MPLNKHVLVKLMIMVELPFSGHPCEFCKCCIIAIWIHYLLDSAVQDIIVRVVSSEISGGKFPAIYSNLSGISGNLLITYINQLFPSSALHDAAAKYACSCQSTLHIFMR